MSIVPFDCEEEVCVGFKKKKIDFRSGLNTHILSINNINFSSGHQ